MAAVTEFVQAFDIPGVEFVPLKVSEGEKGCCFTWKVVVNGQDGPNGISFYEVDEQGKVQFVRDIPAPSPRGFRPLGALAEVRAISPQSPCNLLYVCLAVIPPSAPRSPPRRPPLSSLTRVCEVTCGDACGQRPR